MSELLPSIYLPLRQLHFASIPLLTNTNCKYLSYRQAASTGSRTSSQKAFLSALSAPRAPQNVDSALMPPPIPRIPELSIPAPDVSSALSPTEETALPTGPLDDYDLGVNLFDLDAASLDLGLPSDSATPFDSNDRLSWVWMMVHNTTLAGTIGGRGFGRGEI